MSTYLDINSIRKNRIDINTNNTDIETTQKQNTKENDVKQINKETEEKNKKIYEKYIRTYADLENLRKRVEVEKKNQKEQDLCSFIKVFLPLIDSLNEISYPPNTNKDLIEGINLIKEQVKDIFNDLDIDQINDVGIPFNSKYNEAVSIKESNKYKQNYIIRIIRKGYKTKNYVIRPSFVEIAK